MLEELRSASEQLQVALERYLRICSSTQNACLLSTTALPNHTHIHAQLIDREVGLIDSYDAKLQEARKAIRVTRNQAFNISPISRLPPEVLIRVFHIARDTEPSCVDSLASVCSRWRVVALSSSSLWSHVNFRPFNTKWLYPKLLNLPALHASRSCGTPLDVNLSVISESYLDNNGDNGIKKLCTLVAPRMRSLQLEFERFSMNWSDSNTNSTISKLFSCSVPGVLTKLVTMGYSLFSFFSTSETSSSFQIPSGPSSWDLIVGQSHSELEALFAPITVLHLAGVFPSWTSQAYHNLVELRLYANFTLGGSITELVLVRILKSSPGLRILHFGIPITDRVDEAHVNLPYLEVLHIGSKQGLKATRSPVGIVRLLAPGPRPLHFSIQNESISQFAQASRVEIDAFLARATVARFRLNHVLQPFELVASMPHLEVLVLSECQDLDLYASSEIPPSATYPQISVCILLHCLIPLSKLRSSIQRFQIQSLEIYRGQSFQGGSSAELNSELVRKELLAVCPNVRVTDVHPLLTRYQDLRIPTD